MKMTPEEAKQKAERREQKLKEKEQQKLEKEKELLAKREEKRLEKVRRQQEIQKKKEEKQKKKELKEKQRQEKKEQEEKEKQRKRQEKEEKNWLKQQILEAKMEEKKKKEEQRLKPLEEKKKAEEEKRAEVSANANSDQGYFRPFQIKENMSLAPVIPQVSQKRFNINKESFDEQILTQVDPGLSSSDSYIQMIADLESKFQESQARQQRLINEKQLLEEKIDAINKMTIEDAVTAEIKMNSDELEIVQTLETLLVKQDLELAQRLQQEISLRKEKDCSGAEEKAYLKVDPGLSSIDIYIQVKGDKLVQKKLEAVISRMTSQSAVTAEQKENPEKLEILQELKACLEEKLTLLAGLEQKITDWRKADDNCKKLRRELYLMF